MTIEEVIADHENTGSYVVSLGRAKIPLGYAVLANADGDHCYWVCEDGRESCIHWDRWAVLRGAKADAERRLKAA